MTVQLAPAGEDVPAIVPNEEDYVPQQIFIAETQQFLLASAKSVMVLGKRLSKKRCDLYIIRSKRESKTLLQEACVYDLLGQ